jgi:hypothetical protein
MSCLSWILYATFIEAQANLLIYTPPFSQSQRTDEKHKEIRRKRTESVALVYIKKEVWTVFLYSENIVVSTEP